MLLGGAVGITAVNTARGHEVNSQQLPVHRGSPGDRVPSREEQLAKLAQGTKDSPYDVLIIGGGATGTGCAVDASTRCAPAPPGRWV